MIVTRVTEVEQLQELYIQAMYAIDWFTLAQIVENLGVNVSSVTFQTTVAASIEERRAHLIMSKLKLEDASGRLLHSANLLQEFHDAMATTGLYHLTELILAGSPKFDLTIVPDRTKVYIKEE